ncbi:hypothetical protein E2C01_075738 [Portunus trituberculatus]|uniref:Uncharacterized protein n=1 Tax=Portunus trituberculatus TaxID=210409 RepID=A0A5B7IHV4_PORTR|nr:hypothetical protein [Portunus trituberculatus]
MEPQPHKHTPGYFNSVEQFTLPTCHLLLSCYSLRATHAPGDALRSVRTSVPRRVADNIPLSVCLLSAGRRLTPRHHNSHK